LKRIGLIVAFLAAAVLTPSLGLSFGTINRLGQHSEHERITRAGLARAGFEPATLSLLAGRDGSFGAVGAPDNPLRGLMSDKAAHCDGADHLAAPRYPQSAADAQGRLEACRDYIETQMQAAVASAGRLILAEGGIDGAQASISPACVFNGRPGRAKCQVLEHLGQALHAAQDFYSHANWVDQAGPGVTGPANPPGLNHRGRAPWLMGQGPFPAGLISGCYDGFPEAAYCGGRVRHAALNKDNGQIVITDPAHPVIGVGTTDRGMINDNFRHAVEAAIDETGARWDAFAARLNQRYGEARARRMLCAIRSDEPARCP
jgi:hypothetical protein